MKIYIDGKWIDRDEKIEVLNPFDGTVIDTVPRADSRDVERALESAVQGKKVMASLSSHQRAELLASTVRRMGTQAEDFAKIISLEVGKTLREARAEVDRAIETMALSAEEAKRIHGETIPYDASPSGRGRLGMTLRVPCGVVVAITPFNYPLNLLCHKVGPALAAGNAIIVKPASDTPLSALKLVEVLLESGLPENAIQCLTGPGGELGEALCADPRVRKISFTGSHAIGERITQVAGIKRVTMELGSNAPLIVMPDADLERVGRCIALTGYANSGQSCISTQRVLVSKPIYSDFLDSLNPKVSALVAGDPMDERTDVGPLIREGEAVRVESWINEAVAEGARLVTGGERHGAVYTPSIVADVKDRMRISSDELFGPAVAVSSVEGIEEAIARANDTRYGLSAGIFTRDIEWALRFAQEVESGNIHINWSPSWRVDLMPYGGLKESGLGKEGPRYAIEEMTELKTVVFHREGEDT